MTLFGWTGIYFAGKRNETKAIKNKGNDSRKIYLNTRRKELIHETTTIVRKKALLKF